MRVVKEAGGSCEIGKELTSEKAGALSFLYRFHSSPSEATMFLPKNESTLYGSRGLGHKYREDVTS